MNSWYIGIIELFILFVLFICFIIFLIMLIKAKRKNKNIKTKGLLLSVDVVLFACSIIFVLSHSTYYKFNDWAILNSDINSVVSKYGAFDKGSIQEGSPGRIGYYIYTDNGPIMSDHMDHYYWIYFDESGIVYKVEESLPPGG